MLSTSNLNFLLKRIRKEFSETIETGALIEVVRVQRVECLRFYELFLLFLLERGPIERIIGFTLYDVLRCSFSQALFDQICEKLSVNDALKGRFCYRFRTTDKRYMFHLIKAATSYVFFKVIRLREPYLLIGRLTKSHLHALKRKLDVVNLPRAPYLFEWNEDYDAFYESFIAFLSPHFPSPIIEAFRTNIAKSGITTATRSKLVFWLMMSFMRTNPKFIFGSMALDERWIFAEARTLVDRIGHVHHGGAYLIYDEIDHWIYEGLGFDFHVIPGGCSQRSALKVLSVLKPGVEFVEVTEICDPLPKGPHRSAASGGRSRSAGAQGKRVLFVATDFGTIRYGPYRDMPSQSLVAIRSALLDALQKQEVPCIARPHPKASYVGKDFPSGWKYDLQDFETQLENFDFFVLDYPSTTLFKLIRTHKPVILVDLGLRRIFSEARAELERCVHIVKISANGEIALPELGEVIVDLDARGEFCRKYIDGVKVNLIENERLSCAK